MFQSDLFPAGEQIPAVPLAFAIGARIAALLTSGRHLTRADISGLFAEETGALDWGSAWSIDDYNNAVEIGALLCVTAEISSFFTGGMRTEGSTKRTKRSGWTVGGQH